MKMHTETVSAILWNILNRLSSLEELKQFRLVGGTALSLQLGHRISVDIDLFTDAPYGSVDFDALDQVITNMFAYADIGMNENSGIGKSYYIGNSKETAVKVDLFYTDTFRYPMVEYERIRLSGLEEIVAMKLEVIGQGGRKKDFWDIHELMNYFSWEEMLSFYETKYPYSYTCDEILCKLTDFKSVEYDFEPICLKEKHWDLIKLDIEESIALFRRN